MNCRRVQEIEQNYLSGELGVEDMRQIEQHLKSCRACAERLEGYQELLGRMFGSLEPVAPPAYLRQNLLAELSTLQPAQTRPWWKRFSPVRLQTGFNLVAAIALVTLLAALWMLNGQIAETNRQQVEVQQLADLTSSPDSRIWTMLQPDVPFDTNAPRARMYVRPKSTFYFVTATNLAPLAAGQTYRVWYESAQTVVHYVGPLRPDGVGQATLKIQDPEGTALAAVRCFVTAELATNPADQPTGQLLLVWQRPGS